MARYEDDYNEEPKEQACFIATAVYGTPLAEEVNILRQFRDEFLKTNLMGRAFVRVYYRLSPPVARHIAKHRALRVLVRRCLISPLVAFSKSMRR